MIAAILERAGLTIQEAAELCGVSARTMSNWKAGKTRIPADSLALLEHAAAEMELESSPPMSDEAQREVLGFIKQAIEKEVAGLESDLEDARQRLEETKRQLNTLRCRR
jgi:transcriptional regulator with XRE-family HTH domain